MHGEERDERRVPMRIEECWLRAAFARIALGIEDREVRDATSRAKEEGTEGGLWERGDLRRRRVMRP